MSRWFRKSNNSAEDIVKEHIKDDQPFYSPADFLFEQVNDKQLLEDYLKLCIRHVCEVDATLLSKIKNKDLLKQYLKLAIKEDLILPDNTMEIAKGDKELVDMLKDKFPAYEDIINSRGEI